MFSGNISGSFSILTSSFTISFFTGSFLVSSSSVINSRGLSGCSTSFLTIFCSTEVSSLLGSTRTSLSTSWLSVVRLPTGISVAFRSWMAFSFCFCILSKSTLTTPSTSFAEYFLSSCPWSIACSNTLASFSWGVRGGVLSSTTFTIVCSCFVSSIIIYNKIFTCYLFRRKSW